jgi:hypothetical protein
LKNACYHSLQNLLPSTFLSKNVKNERHKTTIPPVVSYECHTSVLILKKEHRLKVLENRMLRRVFGPKREEVAGNWRRLHNEELHNLCASLNICRVLKPWTMRRTRHVARMGEM